MELALNRPLSRADDSYHTHVAGVVFMSMIVSIGLGGIVGTLARYLLQGALERELHRIEGLEPE